MKRILMLLIILLQPLQAVAQMDISRIEIVVSSNNSTAHELAERVRNALHQRSPSLEIDLQNTESYQNGPSQSTLIITVGDDLLPWLKGRNNNYAGAIAFLANSAEFVAEEKNQNISAIFRDQPLPRQLRLAKLLIPNLHQIALIRSERLLPQNSADMQRGNNLSITEKIINTDSEWVKQLSQLMQSSQVLLGVEDQKIYNGNTIRSILLTTYRHGKSLIGPSRAFVNAGSLASCYTTPEQYLQQLTDMVSVVIHEHRLPPPQYPKSFGVAINKQVAASLNLIIPDEKTLSARLQNQNGECSDGC